jgi:hypothetical protein
VCSELEHWEDVGVWVVRARGCQRVRVPNGHSINDSTVLEAFMLTALTLNAARGKIEWVGK